MNTTLTIRPGAPSKRLVAHAIWRQARSTLLEAASAGPATIALVGEPGTGKSCLLRNIDAMLRKHGQAVTFLPQGDLPWDTDQGSILLIDEASRLSPSALAELAEQRHMIVILADLPAFAKVVQRYNPFMRVVHLPRLDSAQVADFVSQFLPTSGRDPNALTPDAIARIVHHSAGTPRLITRLINAAFAIAPAQAAIDGAVIDEVAMLRWAEPSPPQQRPVAPPVESAERAPAPRPRTSRVRRAATAATLAATIVLTLRSTDLPNHASAAARPRVIEAAAIPAPAAVPLSPIVVAKSGAPSPALDEPPAPLPPSTPILASRPIPGLPPEPETSAADLAQAQPATPTADPVPAPPSRAKLYPNLSPTVARGLEAAVPGEPGLILIARRGDTLRDLYASLYRGVEPPPFEEVVAVNPKPVVAGTVVIFPAPAGGWHQP